jgi:alanyl-tRNA synthetase
MQEKLTGASIRQSFIDFFKHKGHTFVPSAPLVPGEDQTLLFTNAGMVQFKDVFLGTDKRPYSRAVNSQKCMRVAGKHNDLEDVGKDDTHHTFFEMLGNWSFGDYYKKEAISWAWELLTDVWKMDKNRLWVTCFQDERNEIPRDDEAAKAWASQPGLNKNHIVFLGRKENFWEMAETGPCGPCSEIYIDLGEEYCQKKGDPDHICDIQHDCRRFLEFWNLVFIQYNRLSATELANLPARHVDTGMGLERITSILQNKKSNYATDLLLPLMDVVSELTHQTEMERRENITPYRVIADHSRAAAFLIADGVVPGNVGRNYICRMIIRRASRFGGKLGLNEPFLSNVAEKVIEIYGDAYYELKKNKKAILENITREEMRFHSTVETGLSRLQYFLDELKKKGGSILEGRIAFDLYATNGLPFEIARDVAREQGLDIEEKSFRDAMDEHRISSGAGKVFGEMGGENANFYADLLVKLKEENKLIGDIQYDPYTTPEVKTQIIALLKNKQLAEYAQPGDDVEVILPNTCFYIESGGQVADKGWIKPLSSNNWEIKIEKVFRPAAGMVLHSGMVTKGNPKVGEQVIAEVDLQRRMDVMRNHTATHLLHAELRKILGEQARQAGSLVAPDRLRFDFTYNQPLTTEELDHVEQGVNQKILANLSVSMEEKNLSQATQEGAMALFGEKYGEKVRTITISGQEKVSYELCGGTHVEHTGDIGSFIIVTESSIASGTRRIEALTGTAAYQYIHDRLGELRKIASKSSCSIEEIQQQFDNLLIVNADFQKEINELQERLASVEYENKKNQDLKQVKDTAILFTTINGINLDTMRKITDSFRKEYKKGVFSIASIDKITNRLTLMVAVTDDLNMNNGIDAVKLVKEIGPIIGGGGGGKPTLAQAGGTKPENLPDAFIKLESLVKAKIE